MKKIALALSIFLTTCLSAEDSALPPWKKEVVPIIPHAWFSGELLLLKAKEHGLAAANQAQAHSQIRD